MNPADVNKLEAFAWFEYVEPNDALTPCPAKKKASEPNITIAKINPVNSENPPCLEGIAERIFMKISPTDM
jgi:hypothetical protein